MSSKIPEELYYTKEHEWYDPDTGWMGITDFAQQQLGDVVYVELPEVGASVERDDAFVVVESVKAVSDVYSPVTGTIEDVNESLEDHPETVNESPYAEGRIARVAEGDPAGLLDASEYRAHVESS